MYIIYRRTVSALAHQRARDDAQGQRQRPEQLAGHAAVRGEFGEPVFFGGGGVVCMNLCICVCVYMWVGV